MTHTRSLGAIALVLSTAACATSRATVQPAGPAHDDSRRVVAEHAAVASATGHARDYDVLIRGGRVLDGTGNPWYTADVAITGDRIVAVGTLDATRASRVVDAAGMYVAPGFIDAHSHAGPGLARAGLSAAQPLLAQGITTVFINPDGGGPVDLVQQRAAFVQHGIGVNVAQLVPHGSVRQEVIGMQDRAPTAAELERMRALVRAGMEAGGFGLSSGPYYAPGSYATTDELIELARVAAQYGGVYSSHIRDEADYTIGVVAAVDEVIRIAREAALTGVVTHIKALGPRVWGYGAALVSRIERARAEGVSVYADQYPYDASSTSLAAALLPRWAQAGGTDSLRARLADTRVRDSIRAAVLENLDRRGDAGRIRFARADDRSIEGRTLADVAARQHATPADAALDLVATGNPGIVSFNMSSADIDLLMRQVWTMTASDGTLVDFGSGVPHPRAYGTFPRKLRVYAVERNVVSLADAIRSMTSLPASVMGVRERGLLRAGSYADVVVFDLGRLRDAATYDQPHQLAEGMVHVLVNGRFAIDGGSFGDALHGRVLTRR